MITTKCHVCSNTIYLAENDDEQRFDPRSTKYWKRLKNDGKLPLCDAACALVNNMKENNKEVPEWLKKCQ